MENIFAKGGKTKVKYDYIPQKAIDELSYTIDKVTKGISGDKLLSGVYVKSDAKSKTKSGSNLTAKILAMTDDEDKKEVILEKDVKEFQKYISDKLITAFYLGLPLAYDFKGDYSYGGGVITMVVDDAKRKTTQAIKNAKNKKFELGLKYPQYDFEKLLGKPIIKDVFGKTMTFDDGTTEKYQYRLWIWKDCVIGQTIGSENSSRGFKDFTYGEKPTLMGGYKSVQTSKESKLESIINFMAKDKDGFVKDNNVLYNGLGGADFETLETNKIKYAKGGEMNSDDIVSVYQFGKEKDADDFFLMADKFTDYDVLRLSPFAIQYVGGKEGFEFLYDRAETYESNSLDLYAKGGKTKRSKHSIMQDRRRISSEPWEVAYQKRKSKMEAGGTLPTPFGQAGLVGETGAMNEMELFAMGGGLPQGVHQYYAQTYNPAYPTPHGYAKGGKIDTSKKGVYLMELKDGTFRVSNNLGDRDFPYEFNDVFPTKERAMKFANRVAKNSKSKVVEIKYAKGGYLEGKTYYIVDYYSSVSDIPNGIAIKNKSFGTKEDANTFLKSIENKGGRGFVTDFKKPTRDEISKLDRDRNENYMMAKGGSIKVGDKVKYPKATMVGKVKSIKDSDFERTLTIEYDDGKIINEGESSVIKFAKGGMTDVERQSMIDMGYSEEQIKEVEDNPRRGGRFAKGGETEVRYTEDELKYALGVDDDYENWVELAFQSGYKYDESKDEWFLPDDYAKGGEIKMEEGNKIYALAESLTELEKDKLLLTLNEKETEKFNTLIQLGDSVNLALISTLVEESPQYRLNWLKRQKKSSVSNLSMAKGGEIQMSEIYNVNGKDYLFHTPIQNDKGTYTGWDAYEVVYDIKDGEKHLNYTKTKKGKSKYFPNGVKRTEAEDYFAKGGEIQEKRERIAEYIATHEDLDNYGEIDEDWYDWEFDKKLKWVNKNILTDDKEVKYFFDEYLYAKGGEVVGLSISRLHSDFPKGFENSGEVIKKGNSKWKVENGILLRKVGSGDWKEWRKITYAKGGKTQGYNDKLDESLGNTKGKRSTKEQNYKDRRNESEAMEKKGGKRKYASVKTMDKGSRSKRKTPLTLAKEIRKEGEKWQDAVKRASAILKKKAK